MTRSQEPDCALSVSVDDTGNESIGEWVEIDRIKGWDRNPKIHPKEQVSDLAKSIKRFGWGAPLLARRNGELIAGHGRLAAARELGLTKVPVRWLNLDPTEAHLLALADNKLTEAGAWDDVLVAEILESAKQDGADLAGLGWSSAEVDVLLQEASVTELDMQQAFEQLTTEAPTLLHRSFLLSATDAEELDARVKQIGGDRGQALMRLVRGER